MNKTDLVALVAQDVDLPKTSVTKCIDSFLEIVQQKVAEGEKVSFIGFGTLESRLRAARTCHNPKTGEQMNVGPRRQVRFVVGKKFKDRLQD